MPISCDKDWIDLVAALSIPVIATIAAYVAWQQWKINERRLKHELFDRNFKVYDAILRFIGSVMASGKANDEHLSEFNRETRAAKFLLDDEIVQLIDELYEKAIDLQTYDAELEGLPVGSERSRLVKQRSEIKKWIYRQFGELDRRFEKTLALRH